MNQSKSFAKYLGEMLSSQARHTDTSFTNGKSEVLPTDTSATQNYES